MSEEREGEERLFGVSLTDLARVHAAERAGVPPRERLDELGLDPHTFSRAEQAWSERLATSLRDDPSLFVAYDIAIAAALESDAPKIVPLEDDLGAWISFEGHFQRAADPAELARSAGLTLLEMARLHRSWALRIAGDPALAEEAASKRAEPPAPLPEIRREPRRRPAIRPAPLGPATPVAGPLPVVTPAFVDAPLPVPTANPVDPPPLLGVPPIVPVPSATVAYPFEPPPLLGASPTASPLSVPTPYPAEPPPLLSASPLAQPPSVPSADFADTAPVAQVVVPSGIHTETTELAHLVKSDRAVPFTGRASAEEAIERAEEHAERVQPQSGLRDPLRAPGETVPIDIAAIARRVLAFEASKPAAPAPLTPSPAEVSPGPMPPLGPTSPALLAPVGPPAGPTPPALLAPVIGPSATPVEAVAPSAPPALAAPASGLSPTPPPVVSREVPGIPSSTAKAAPPPVVSANETAPIDIAAIARKVLAFDAATPPAHQSTAPLPPAQQATAPLPPSPPSSPQTAVPAPPSRPAVASTSVRSANDTAPMDVASLAAKASTLDPTSKPAPSQPAFPGLPFSLDEVAAISAELSLHPENSKAIWARAGVHDTRTAAAIMAEVNKRLNSDAVFSQAWQVAFATHHERIAGGQQ